jgi:phenylalanyl-tRNA synthetase beta chain
MSDIEMQLNRLGFTYEANIEEESFVVTAPFERLDIAIPEDVIEEVGRIAGYADIKAVALEKPEAKPVVNKRAAYAAKVREFMTSRGYSEVYTYAFSDGGAVALANPLASDKGYLRPDLRTGLAKSLELNARNADLLGLEAIRLFEIGTIFPSDGERIALGIALRYPGNVKKEQGVVTELADILNELSVFFVGDLTGTAPTEGVVEINFDALITILPEPKDYGWPKVPEANVRYKRPSAYPFVLRDIAVWVPEKIPADEVLAIITEKAGGLLLRHRLFDEFKKDDRVSYAFRLVFQSHEKTLTDDEVNLIMWQVTAALNEREGWEVR